MVERTTSGTVELAALTGDGNVLPREPSKNCATVAAATVLDRFGQPGDGLRVHLTKVLPLGSGMGSSAASAVAAALAAATVLTNAANRPTKLDLLDACREGERLATGVPHPDNVAPSLLGGIVACIPRGGETIEVVSLPVPEGLWIAAVKPDVTVKTADARAALPTQVSMEDAVHQIAAIAGFVAALASGDLALLGRSLEDRLATPYRRQFIPGFEEARRSADAAGAIGGGISGSGPTVFALAADRATAEAAAGAMTAVFEGLGHKSIETVSAVDLNGARLELNWP